MHLALIKNTCVRHGQILKGKPQSKVYRKSLKRSADFTYTTALDWICTFVWMP